MKNYTISTLKAPVTIHLDKHGIPHIYAENEADLFMAQGFNAARDRLWQIDLWRKKGLGLLAKDFGAGYLAQDYASRLFLYRGCLEKEWAAYGAGAKTIVENFVAGINAYVQLTRENTELLPPEFTELKTQPDFWEAKDAVIIRSHAMSRNIISEVLRTHMPDLAADLLRQNLEPPIIPSIDPDCGEVPLKVLELYKLALANVTFSKERLSASLQDVWKWVKVTELNEVIEEATLTGSNNWVIAPSKSATGRAIVANDPHRAHSLPGIRYLAHLHCPTLHVAGHGEPMNAGIAFGHNEKIAFGFTIFYSDQEDLFFYDVNPSDSNQYKFQNEYVFFDEVEEYFEIKGAIAQAFTLKFTKHGAVLYEDFISGRAYAVKSVWFEAGAAPYMHSLKVMRASNIHDYREAIKGWGTPSGNCVVGDIDGEIGWMPAGFTPIRTTYDGLLPVSGAGKHDWQGILPTDDLPRVINPAKGYFATANEMNLPLGYDKKVGYEWYDKARTTRIHTVLDGLKTVSLQDSCALQTDDFSNVAKILCEMLVNNHHFKSWDYKSGAHSSEALLFDIWLKHLKKALLNKLVLDKSKHALIMPMNMDSLVKAASENQELLEPSLQKAYEECESLQGNDASKWQWGKLHHAYFEHPLSPLWGDKYDVGKFEIGGSLSSPMMMNYRADFRVTHGASVRLVMDVGAWDNCLCINTTGQSGDPRSQHYRDLAPLWAKGEYIPLLFSREAVEKNSVAKIILQP